MIEGALIFLAGIIIGVTATVGVAYFSPERGQKEDKYDRYRNEHGLLTRRAAKG